MNHDNAWQCCCSLLHSAVLVAARVYLRLMFSILFLTVLSVSLNLLLCFFLRLLQSTCFAYVYTVTLQSHQSNQSINQSINQSTDDMNKKVWEVCVCVKVKWSQVGHLFTTNTTVALTVWHWHKWRSFNWAMTNSLTSSFSLLTIHKNSLVAVRTTSDWDAVRKCCLSPCVSVQCL